MAGDSLDKTRYPWDKTPGLPKARNEDATPTREEVPPATGRRYLYWIHELAWGQALLEEDWLEAMTEHTYDAVESIPQRLHSSDHQQRAQASL